MKRIAITIATRNRQEKLKRCLDSIPDLEWVDVFVCCDQDKETYENFTHPRIDLLVNTMAHIGSPACHNLLMPYVNDGVLYLMDDMELLPDTLETALSCFNRHFPDDDGMLGIHQFGMPKSESGTALLGYQFLERYPRKKANYPGYWHFSDMEILALAKKIGRYRYCESAIIKHYHPDCCPEEKDQTHFDARVHREKDFELFNARQKAGRIYGFNDFAK